MSNAKVAREDTTMIKHCWILMFLFLPAVVFGGQASGDAADIHNEIRQIYNFQPHTLSDAQITQKSAALDQFWSKAKSQSAVYVPALRKELADFSNPTFFLYDGSKLLLSLSKDPADRKLILAAVARSDLRDLQSLDYFMLVHSMAAQGEDTAAAAFHVLEQPKFQVFIVQHSLRLAQDYCLIYMLLPTDESFWIRPAIDRLASEKDLTAQKSLLLLLFYAQTSEADQAIARFSADAAKQQAARSYADELIRREHEPGVVAGAASITETEESLRQARRDRMKAVSDEALYDLDSSTAKIIAKRK